jgi:hypothetical protein
LGGFYRELIFGAKSPGTLEPHYRQVESSPA